MFEPSTRRQFLAQVGVAAASAALPTGEVLAADTLKRSGSRVAIARDESLMRGRVNEHGELLSKLLDAALQRVTGAADAVAAWRSLFRPRDRVGIKVNTLGLSTQPAVVDAIVAGLSGSLLTRALALLQDIEERQEDEPAQSGRTIVIEGGKPDPAPPSKNKSSG